jgi:AraC-like DNA-binding protein
MCTAERSDCYNYGMGGSEAPTTGRTSFLARAIAGMTGLDVYWRSDGRWARAAAGSTPSSLLEALEPEIMGERFGRTHSGSTIVADDYGFSWLTGAYHDDVIVVGPFLLGTLSARGAELLARSGALPPSRTEEEVQGIADVLLLANSAADRTDFRGEDGLTAAAVRRVDVSGSHNPAVDPTYRVEAASIARRYEYERGIRDAVARGDRAALSSAIGGGFETRPFYHRLPGNPLRIEKNLTVVLNTILRNSAEAGGLLPLLVHGISDEFAVRIEQARRVDDMAPLRTEMMYRYCDAVRRHSIAHHSMPVRLVTTRILTDLAADHSLSELAEVAGCSPSYLSRLFRAEYGTTIGAFIRERRIAEARWMLAQSDTPLAEITDALGFGSLNYFRRVFRQVTGTTPGVYRRQYRRSP